MGYVLGIDIGTGSTKAVALGLNSEPVLVSQIHYPTYSPKPGFSEQDPNQIWDAFKNCLQLAIDKMGESPKAIGLSSAMHSLIPVDQNGEKLVDLITWADSRSDEIALRIKTSEQGEKIFRTSGMPLHAMSPLCKIIWIKENDPDLFSKANKFISIKEYIWFKMFNEYRVDFSIAGSFGMFDLETLTWSPEILKLAGIGEDRLSEPVNTNYTRKGIGSLNNSITGYSEDLTFVIGASDGCLANLGSFALVDGVAALTVGTSGAIRVASLHPIISNEQATFSYFLDDDHFINGGPVNNGGNVLQWYIRNFLLKDLSPQSYTDFFTSIESIPAGSENLWFLPYLNGERAPIWDAKSCGTFFGIKPIHTQTHFSRAVLEGICFALKDVLNSVEQSSNEIKQLNVSGGFVNSDVWMQMLADVTGKKLSLLQTEDASAIGAAFMAAKVSGLSTDYSNPPETMKEKIIKPDSSNFKMYHEKFVIFKELYSDLKDTMHKIHLNP